MATSSRTGISRIDQPATRTHGFVVRVGYKRTVSGTWRPRHQAFFGDASNGGKKGALKAAESWVSKLVKGRSKKSGRQR
ncbi:MAG: hypothetical protein ABJD07_03140 [Gemmatimonadaceae bacterium]